MLKSLCEKSKAERLFGLWLLVALSLSAAWACNGEIGESSSAANEIAASAKPGRDASSKRIVPPSTRSDAVAPEKAAIVKSPSAEDIAYARAVQKHGPDTVLRPKLFKPTDNDGQKLGLHKANWKHPIELSFVKLQKNYQFYRVHKKFFPQGIPTAHGAAVVITGAVMPIEPPGPDGELQRFWLANPTVVMAGCVFCNPPTLGDLVYVEVEGDPVEVDRERLYASVLISKVMGRFFARETRTKDGVSYIYSMKLKEIVD